MKIFVKRENWSDGIWMQLPATKEEAEQVRRSLERQHPSMMLPFVGAVDSRFPELEERLVGELVFQEKNLDRLNQLAERLASLNGAEEMLFRAAFRMEAPYTTEQILETLGHLDRYRLHPEIGNLEELGRYLSQEETSQLPEGLEAYVDYAGIGRLRQEDWGYLTEGGYVEKRKDLVEQTEAGEEQNREKEPETEKRQGVFAVTLIRESFTDRYVRFMLPLPEQELTEKKRQAGITEEIPERVEISASIDGLLEHLPPGSTLEELNEAAKVVEEMEACSKIDWKLAFAALEAELPGTMEECCRIIRNHQAYEFLPFPFLEPESFGHYYLEQDIAQDQDEYQNRYNGLVQRYETAKTRYDEVAAAISAKEAQSERLVDFIRMLKKQDGSIAEFDERLWGCMVDFVTVGRKKEITVTFRDGTEIQA